MVPWRMATLRKTTSVWWDISSCPIPEGFDPCLVGRRIETALKKSGYSDPVTITAIGNLREGEGPGEDVLRKLSSSGIALTHSSRPAPTLSDLTSMDWRNSYPATTMLIFGGRKELAVLDIRFYNESEDGYRILLAHPQLDPSTSSRWKSFLNNAHKEWLWKSLLSGSADKTTRLVLQSKYTETGKSPWYCSLCHFTGQSLEDFTTHLKTGTHGYNEWDLWASGKNVNRTIPENFVWGLSEEWDLLNHRDLACCGGLPYKPPLETTVVESPSKEKCKKKKLKRPLTVN